jgi:hypothetical protein
MASDPTFIPLPIDNTAGFPQRFPFLFAGVRYQFSLYVDVPEWALGSLDELMELPDANRFLVARVDVPAAEGTRTVFLRKVVPSLAYRAGGLLITFPSQVVARRNLNGNGQFGSNVVGQAAAFDGAGGLAA